MSDEFKLEEQSFEPEIEKPIIKEGTLDIRLMDCMEMMKEFPDKHFDLAIVDPPYGINIAKSGIVGGHGKNILWKGCVVKKYKPSEWDNEAPSIDYFNELRRVSKNQIIFGANYFIEKIESPNSPCWIIWDKMNNGDFADAELAWASFKTLVRKINLLWDGFRRCEQTSRIHPTQKPITLYSWILENYAKQGDKILDTHLGSGSHAIACHYAGMHLTACEIDADYYQASMERIKRETAQGLLI